MKRVNELRSPGDLIVFPQTLAKKKVHTLQLTTSPSPSPSSDCDIHSTSPRHQSPIHSPSYAPPLDSPKTRPTPQNPPACPLSHSAAQRPTYPTHSPCQTPSFARETLRDKYNSPSHGPALIYSLGLWRDGYMPLWKVRRRMFLSLERRVRLLRLRLRRRS